MTGLCEIRESVLAHPSATVDDRAQIGPGTRIWDHVKIREGVRVGAGCNIGQNVYIDFGVSIGEGVKIQNNVSVYHGVTVGDHVFIGPNATFTNDRCPRADLWDAERLGLTVLEDGCSIGANSTIICGSSRAPRRIGRRAMVAAGAVVTRDVPDHGLVMGNPARLTGFVSPKGFPANEVVEEDGEVVVLTTETREETVRIDRTLYHRMLKERNL